MPERLNRQLLLRNPALQNEKCAVFTIDGDLLWHSPGWGSDVRREVLGLRWLEFVHYSDAAGVLDFLAAEDLNLHSFRIAFAGLDPAAVVTWNKATAYEHVVVIGDFSPLVPFLPAPRTLV